MDRLQGTTVALDSASALSEKAPEGDSVRRFHHIERTRLVDFNTPIERCDRLRAMIPGAPNLFIKRDDYAGYLAGGNKLRKIEYFMAEVLKSRATAVITVGSIQSNHARVMAMVARRFGLKCTLVLNGCLPKRPTGNFLVNSLLGVKIHLVKTRAEREEKMAKVAQRLAQAGERVFSVPLGASDALGSFGLVAAYEEVVAYQRANGMTFDAIFLASSSGGTQAGLEVGKRLFGYPNMKIIGVSPDDSSQEIQSSMASMMRLMMNQLKMNSTVSMEELQVDDDYVGEGYGIPSAASLRASQMFLQAEGILLDPVYTSKAAAGFINYCKKHRFDPKANVLFWHTGGLLAVFR